MSKAQQETKSNAMKRYGYLYEKLIDVENCKLAIIRASKGKRKRKYVQKILANIDYYANDLSLRLQNLDFTSPYYEKLIVDKSSKKERIINIPKFYPDLCSQHAINQVMIPLVEKGSYHYSCANFKGRGLKRANKGTKRLVRNCTLCLKLDISKFYYSVENKILKNFLLSKIKDSKFLKVLYHLIDTIKGLPIGNYTSPQLAEWFLQIIDRLVKQVARIKNYVRYADDMTLGDTNKQRLRYAFRLIIKELKRKGLKLKANWQLFKTHTKDKLEKYGKGRKIDFIGNCYSKEYRTIRKSTALNLMRRSRLISRLIAKGYNLTYKLASGIMSQYAVFKRTNSFGMKKKYEVYMKQIKEVIRSNTKCLQNNMQVLDLTY